MVKKVIKKAFGLIEVMVASSMILIILLALTAATKSALQGNQDIYARAQALFLAQEGIETVREIRDSSWSAGQSGTGSWKSLVWNAAKDKLIDVTDLTTTSCYKIDYVGSPLYQFGLTPLSCTNLDQNQSSMELVQLNQDINNSNAKFYRYVKIEPIGNQLMPDGTGTANTFNQNNSFKLTVYLQYGQNKTLSISEILTNWWPKY